MFEVKLSEIVFGFSLIVTNVLKVSSKYDIKSVKQIVIVMLMNIVFVIIFHSQTLLILN